jgi:hypothetical protein
LPTANLSLVLAAIVQETSHMTSQSIRRVLGLAALMLAFILLAAPGAAVRAEDAQWTGRFWNNKTLSGDPVLTRFENSIDFRWGDGSPDPLVNDDNFSAQWTRRVYFPAGTYRFTAVIDDAMRVYIDNNLIMDYWNDSQEHTATVDLPLSEGDHDIKIDYYEAGGVATAIFNWQNIGAGGGGAFFPNWKGEYFTNPTLSGAPALVRDDRYLSHNWGTGSPAPGIPADNFSVRWTRTYQVVPGTYRLRITSDDGARAFINDRLVIDNWQQQAATTSEVILTSNGAPFQARLEYFDSWGDALIVVELDLIESGGVLPGDPILPSTCPVPSGLLASVNTAVLNVRRGPSTQFEIADRMSQCQTARLTGFTNATRDWVELVTPGGVVGWATTRYLLLGTPTSQMTVK